MQRSGSAAGQAWPQLSQPVVSLFTSKEEGDGRHTVVFWASLRNTLVVECHKIRKQSQEMSQPNGQLKTCRNQAYKKKKTLKRVVVVLELLLFTSLLLPSQKL